MFQVGLAAFGLFLIRIITADGSWYEFSFFDTTDEARGCYPTDPDPNALDCLPSSADNSVFVPAPSWDFTVQLPALITVTDAFLHGDSFDIFDGGGVPIFSTPVVTFDGDGCGDNPVNCLADPDASHASFLLGPEAHFITITPNAIGDAGAAYLIRSTRANWLSRLPSPSLLNLAPVCPLSSSSEPALRP
jgi:hypothetical protein